MPTSPRTKRVSKHLPTFVAKVNAWMERENVSTAYLAAKMGGYSRPGLHRILTGQTPDILMSTQERIQHAKRNIEYNISKRKRLELEDV